MLAENINISNNSFNISEVNGTKYNNNKIKRKIDM